MSRDRAAARTDGGPREAREGISMARAHTAGTAPRPDLARIAVVGTSCSGKSTLAGRLATSLECPRVELDELHWGPGWSTDSTDAFRRKVDVALEPARWVCAGNYSAVRDIVWRRATTLVWLDLSFVLTFSRATRRTARRTLLREPVCGDNREPWLGFLDAEWIPYWVVRTWARNRRRIPALAQSRAFAPLDLVVLRTRAEVERFAVDQSLPARSASTSSSSERSAASST